MERNERGEEIICNINATEAALESDEVSRRVSLSIRRPCIIVYLFFMPFLFLCVAAAVSLGTLCHV